MALLYDSNEWTFDALRRTTDAIDEIAIGEIGMDIYPNQIEVITSEQMLDAYSSHGLPLMYQHWSFGKRFARHHHLYHRGFQGLAYEIVLNTSPCIVYIMEENSMTMQALVTAHAAYGHNHFFKNNAFFQQWTNAEGIMEYLAFGKRYIAECEERHGMAAVERIVDAAHALADQGVDRYTRKKIRQADEKKRIAERMRHAESTWNPLWSTLPHTGEIPPNEVEQQVKSLKAALNMPEENLLYFVEKHAPKLKGWEREIVRIVRKISQYFLPQKMAKVSNEGCATWTHHKILTLLNDRGRISDGSYLEMLHSHSGVTAQPTYDSKHYSGWNPYALGFAINRDVERMCMEPTREDEAWFPSFAGNRDPYGTLREMWATCRDDGTIHQYMSPKVMRDFRMFHLEDRAAEKTYRVGDIHDEEGYRSIRSKLAANYDTSRHEPEINVTDLDLMGDRRLVLTHSILHGRTLNSASAKKVLDHLHVLWGYPVQLIERDAMTDAQKGSITVGD